MSVWCGVKRCDPLARALADRHYSRQTPGAREFMGNGRTLVLLTECCRAVWGVIDNRPPRGGPKRWRVSIFRNEGAGLSSELIRAATDETFRRWVEKYGELPPRALTTEVDPDEVHSANPGFCFRMAGWERVGVVRGLVVFRAPGERERLSVPPAGVAASG